MIYPFSVKIVQIVNLKYIDRHKFLISYYFSKQCDPHLRINKHLTLRSLNHLYFAYPVSRTYLQIVRTCLFSGVTLGMCLLQTYIIELEDHVLEEWAGAYMSRHYYQWSDQLHFISAPSDFRVCPVLTDNHTL